MDCPPNTKDLDKVVYNWEHPLREIKIGIVGKYTDLTESYKSLDEALQHAAIENQLKLSLVYIDAEEIEDDSRREDILKEIHGILVPGGFGERGTEGKIKAIEFARKNKVPFFGICLGMQLAMVEFARNVADLKEATSEEFSETGDHVIHYMDGQTRDGSKGGSMRLGAYECQLQKGTLVNKIYGTSEISERHRHRLEVNNEYINKIKSHGMVISGVNEKLNLVEVIELEDHPYFIACQYHPEFKSRPYDPHPLFKTFIEAADKERKE